MFWNRLWTADTRRAATGYLCAISPGIAAGALAVTLSAQSVQAFEPVGTAFPSAIPNISLKENTTNLASRLAIPRVKPAPTPIQTAAAHQSLVTRDLTARLSPRIPTSTAGHAIDARWHMINQQTASLVQGNAACLQGLATCANKPLQTWANLITAARTMPKHKQLAYVNRGVNALISYNSDDTIWKQPDYWAAPSETLTRRVGDCEDYATLKYWTLKQLGYATEDMQVVAVYDTQIQQYHAVLNLSYKGGEYILDNRFGRIALKKDTPNYKWVHVAGSSSPKPIPQPSISLAQMVSAQEFLSN